MKRFYTFFLLVLGSLFGALQMSAQYELADTPSSVIEAGKKYVLQSAKDMTKVEYFKYYNTTTGPYFSSKVDDETIVEFVDASPGEAVKSYYIKNVKSGAYVEDPNYTFSSTYLAAWTDNVGHAARLIPTEQLTVEGSDGFRFQAAEQWGGYTVFFCPLAFIGPGYNVEPAAEAMLPAQTWLVYEVLSMSARSELEDLLFNKIPGGVTPETWVVGTTPGCVSQTIFDALKQAYDEAMIVDDNTEASEEVIEAAVTKLREAYENALASVVPVTEGYYFLTIPISVTGGTRASAYTYNYTNDYGDFSSACWKETPDTEVFDPSLVKFIWKVVKTEDGAFIFQNLQTGTYLPTSTSQNVSLVLSDTPGYFSIVYQPDNVMYLGGVFNILNIRAGSCPVEALSGEMVGYSGLADPTSEYAVWNFVPVSEKLLQDYEDYMQQAALKEELSGWIVKSQNVLDKLKIYNSEVVLNGEAATPGKIDYVETNAQETTEGSVELAIDGDVTTFFHSTWSDAESAPSDYHYIQAALMEPVETFALKMVKRMGTATNYPTKIEVLGSNDADGEFASLGIYPVHFNKKIVYGEGSSLDTGTSVTFIENDKSYSFIRVKVLETSRPTALINGYPFFNLSEIGIYDAVYDEKNSSYATIDAAVMSEFENALNVAIVALSSNNITRSDIDPLVAAYEKLMTQFADADEIREALEEAFTFYNTAVEGDELGQYMSGSTEVYHDALNSVENAITSVMTPAVRDSLLAAIETAYNKFNDALNQPDPDALYYIKSASSDASIYEHFLYVRNNDVTPAGISFSVDGSSEQNEEVRLNYMWRFVPVTGGYYLQNVATGTYLGEAKVADGEVNMTYEPTLIQLRSARSAEDAYNFRSGDNFVCIKSYAMAACQNPTGSDEGAFTLVPADYQATYLVSKLSQVQIMTLPFAVRASDQAGFYKVLGVKDNSLQTKRYANDEVVEAGCPFLLLDENSNGEIYFDLVAEEPANLSYATAPLTQNGLVGTFLSTSISKPLCVLRSGKVDYAIDNQRIEANCGYFDLTKAPTTEETGDLAFALSADVINGVQTVVLETAKDNAKSGIFTLSGQRLNNGVKLQKLPKGIYIVNGRKVVVK